jgi:hypothetical protein
MPDLFDVASVESELVGWDACVWGVGITILGRNEEDYAKVTVDLTLLWARTLLRLNPDFSFCYCSAGGAGGNAKWARVRQRAETGLAAMPFRHVASVRPNVIQPGPGIRSGVRAYRFAIHLLTPFFPLLLTLFPGFVTTSARLGRAMLRVVEGRAGEKGILESRDINRVGA